MIWPGPSENNSSPPRADELRGYLYVFAGAALWGSIGLFFTALHNLGLGVLTIGFLRASITGLVLLALGLVHDRSFLRLPPSSVAFFALFGLLGVALFYILNIEAVLLTDIPTASVMLYTAPAWVTLFAWRVWGQVLSLYKLTVLAGVFVGIVMVSQLAPGRAIGVSLSGLLVPLGSGVTYAVYTLFSKAAVRRHTYYASVTFSLLFGAFFLLVAGLLPLPGAAELIGAGVPMLTASSYPLWVVLAGLCLGPTLCSYLLYNAGLTRIPATNASIVASVEPVTAALLGSVWPGQRLEAGQWVGAALIVGGAIALALEKPGRDLFRVQR